MQHFSLIPVSWNRAIPLEYKAETVHRGDSTLTKWTHGTEVKRVGISPRSGSIRLIAYRLPYS
jgi:hypothetical protein